MTKISLEKLEHNQHRFQSIWASCGRTGSDRRQEHFHPPLARVYLAGKPSGGRMCRCHNPLTLHAVTTRGMLVPSNAITVASRRQDTTSGWHSDWSPTPPPSRPVNSKAFESIDRRWWKNRSSIKNTSICTYLASLRSKNDGHEKKEREREWEVGM